MSIQPTTPPRADIQLDEIQHLDFEPECGHFQHGNPGPWPHAGPARVIVDSHCPKCPAHAEAGLLLCLPWWQYILGAHRGTAAEFYTFRAWVNP